MERLSCSIQTYAWGVKGKASLVAQIKAADDDQFVVNEDTPYAELWIGSHHALPATLRRSGASMTSLHDHLGDGLPFMMKIMSEQAALLHTRDAVNYPDTNHKREMVYALTEFHLLLGWRPMRDIRQHLQDYPQLVEILGGGALIDRLCLGDEDALRECLRWWLDDHRRASHLERIQQMINLMKNAPCLLSAPALFVRLHASFPSDVGCVAAFLLDELVLNVGDCVFYDNQVPHAYLSGDCIECVSTSNNTIRAAMTPKHRDVASFVEMVDTNEHQDFAIHAQPVCDGVVEFDPHCHDFALRRIALTSATTRLPIRAHACLLVVTLGAASINGMHVERGAVLLIEAGTRVVVESPLHVEAFVTFQP